MPIRLLNALIRNKLTKRDYTMGVEDYFDIGIFACIIFQLILYIYWSGDGFEK